jgi:hypothetical protein
VAELKPWSDMTPEERAAWFAAMREQADAVAAKLRQDYPRIGLRVKGLRDRRYNG